MIDDGTFGIRWTVARIATVLLATGQSTRTVFIDQTFGLATSAVRIALVPFGTETLGPMDVDATQSVGSARFENAGILTLAIDASFRGRTVGIGSAARLETLDLRIAGETFSADADGPVLNDSALGVRCANAGPLDARIEATLFDTSLSCLAIRIDFAFGLDHRFDDGRTRLTSDERVASEAISAGADRVVSDHLTAGVDSASSWARISTFLGDTGHAVGTVRVGDALGFAGDVRIA